MIKDKGPPRASSATRNPGRAPSKAPGKAHPGKTPTRTTTPATDSARKPGVAVPVRIQKVLAEAGLGSRREIEGWIEAGRIEINGVVAKLGDRLAPGDRLRLDRRELRLAPPSTEPLRVIAYNKPEGEVVTRHDPEGRPTIFRHLPPLEQGRWIAVGRLDINTSGLLLLTNNGDLANRLMHPSQEIEREYAVRVLGAAPKEALQRLVHGVELEDGPARFEEIVESTVSHGVNHWYHVLLREGRHREVRRLWEAVGLKVSRLMRVRFANVILGPRVFSHHWRDLTPEELDGLLTLVGMKKPSLPHPKPGPRSHWKGARAGTAKPRVPRRS
jgi:23S rRNA pseudouridine2605 synthase